MSANLPICPPCCTSLRHPPLQRCQKYPTLPPRRAWPVWILLFVHSAQFCPGTAERSTTSPWCRIAEGVQGGLASAKNSDFHNWQLENDYITNQRSYFSYIKLLSTWAASSLEVEANRTCLTLPNWGSQPYTFHQDELRELILCPRIQDACDKLRWCDSARVAKRYKMLAYVGIVGHLLGLGRVSLHPLGT